MKKRIHLIEDDEFLLEILNQKLLEAGYETKISKTASEALEILKKSEEKPDLILLDLILPGMNGFEFLEEVKNDPSLSLMPIIVLSNLGQDEEIKAAKKLGARDYLVKAHFTTSEILKKIKVFFDSQNENRKYADMAGN